MTSTKPEIVLDTGIDDECPICAQNPPFNSVTLAAMREARDMASGKIPGKWYSSIEDIKQELRF